MIVRVFRARVRRGKHAEFERMLRKVWIPRVKEQKRLISFYSGGPAGRTADGFTMVTVWPDLDAVQASMGSDWETVVIHPEERLVLRQVSVDHYEVLDSRPAA